MRGYIIFQCGAKGPILSVVGHNHLVVAWVVLATWAGGVSTSQAALGPGRGRQANYAHAAGMVPARVVGIHGTNDPWLTPGPAVARLRVL